MNLDDFVWQDDDSESAGGLTVEELDAQIAAERAKDAHIEAIAEMFSDDEPEESEEPEAEEPKPEESKLAALVVEARGLIANGCSGKEFDNHWGEDVDYIKAGFLDDPVVKDFLDRYEAEIQARKTPEDIAREKALVESFLKSKSKTMAARPVAQKRARVDDDGADWLPYPEAPDRYAVDQWGRVKGLAGRARCKAGLLKLSIYWRPAKDGQGKRLMTFYSLSLPTGRRKVPVWAVLAARLKAEQSRQKGN